MNPAQIFGDNLPQYDENKLKQLLPKLDNSTLEQAKSMAKMFGMTDAQINQGLIQLKNLKKSIKS